MSTIELGLQIGFLYCPFALGIYVAMRALSLPDLTLEGSFGLGGCVCAAMLADGRGAVPSLAIGCLGGAALGLLTTFLHLRLHLNVLLAGILVTTGSWSLCILVMGASNVSLLTQQTIFTWAQDAGLDSGRATLFVAGGITVVLGAALIAFFNSRLGLSMRATGMNIQTARSMGVRTEARQAVGLATANGLAACSGALVAQQQGFMDVSASSGVVVIGLAALMIGIAVIPSPRPHWAILSVILGACIYRTMVAWTLEQGLDPNYVKLVTAVAVATVLAVRNASFSLKALPWTEGGRRRRRRRFTYYENDKVATFL
ncbi:ABC transporter permease [Dactylosporangium sp. CA-233914]|uniref:ABC transporter permease n=1 Tax=Dactylosporangium sp. CA-233914 TaxID=3239934 RepID=UPI003D94BFC7